MWEANTNVLKRRDESRDRGGGRGGEHRHGLIDSNSVHTRRGHQSVDFLFAGPGLQRYSGPCKSPSPLHSPTNQGHRPSQTPGARDKGLSISDPTMQACSSSSATPCPILPSFRDSDWPSQPCIFLASRPLAHTGAICSELFPLVGFFTGIIHMLNVVTTLSLPF